MSLRASFLPQQAFQAWEPCWDVLFIQLPLPSENLRQGQLLSTSTNDQPEHDNREEQHRPGAVKQQTSPSHQDNRQIHRMADICIWAVRDQLMCLVQAYAEPAGSVKVLTQGAETPEGK